MKWSWTHHIISLTLHFTPSTPAPPPQFSIIMKYSKINYVSRHHDYSIYSVASPGTQLRPLPATAQWTRTNTARCHRMATKRDSFAFSRSANVFHVFLISKSSRANLRGDRDRQTGVLCFWKELSTCKVRQKGRKSVSFCGCSCKNERREFFISFYVFNCELSVGKKKKNKNKILTRWARKGKKIKIQLHAGEGKEEGMRYDSGQDGGNGSVGCESEIFVTSKHFSHCIVNQNCYVVEY